MTMRFLGIMGLLASVTVMNGCANQDPEDLESADDAVGAMEDDADMGSDIVGDMDPGLDTTWLGAGFGCGLAGVGYPGYGFGAGFGYPGLGVHPGLAGLGIRVPGYAIFTDFSLGACGCDRAVTTTIVAAESALTRAGRAMTTSTTVITDPLRCGGRVI